MATGLDPALEEPRPIPEERRALPGEENPVRWVRANLFNNALNSVLTVVFSLLLGFALFRAARFVIVSGRWEIIEANLANYMLGRFTRAEIFRVWIVLYLGAASIGTGIGLSSRTVGSPSLRERLRRLAPPLVGLAVLLSFTRTPTPALLTLGGAVVLAAGYLIGRLLPPRAARRLPLVYLVLMIGGFVVLAPVGGGVDLNRWGGFLLTMFVAIGGIVASFPLGILLGLGRRSTLPVVRVFSVLYIELIRGVPLITLLFIGSVTIGLFLPPGADRPSLVTRGLIVVILFTAAYLAEVVRGGLQSVPRGQTEAAKAIGLSPLKTTALIVLPQALRNVIPAIVGQFISLLKDTSLLTAIGLIELLGVGTAVLNQDAFKGQGLQPESLAFVAFLYWICCYSMSRASQRLERRLGVGER